MNESQGMASQCWSVENDKINADLFCIEFQSFFSPNLGNNFHPFWNGFLICKIKLINTERMKVKYRNVYWMKLKGFQMKNLIAKLYL